jgi:hypothetical protein
LRRPTPQQPIRRRLKRRRGQGWPTRRSASQRRTRQRRTRQRRTSRGSEYMPPPHLMLPHARGVGAAHAAAAHLFQCHPPPYHPPPCWCRLPPRFPFQWRPPPQRPAPRRWRFLRTSDLRRLTPRGAVAPLAARGGQRQRRSACTGEASTSCL